MTDVCLYEFPGRARVRVPVTGGGLQGADVPRFIPATLHDQVYLPPSKVITVPDSCPNGRVVLNLP